MAGEALDRLEIEISSSSSEAVERVNELTKSLERLREASSLKGMENTAEKIKSLGEAGNKLSVDIDKTSISALDSLIERVKALKDAIDQVNETQIRVQSEISTDTTGPASGSVGRNVLMAESAGIRRTSSVRTDVPTTETGAQEIESREVDKLSASLDVASTSVKETGKSISSYLLAPLKLLGSAASFAVTGVRKLGNNLVSLSYSAINSVESGLKSIAKRLTPGLTAPIQKTIGEFNKWKSAIGRVIFYRMIRSAIRMVTQGFHEGIENLYYFSQLAGTQFSSTMDRLASSSLYLKNSLGAMAAPLIQAVAPAIDYIIDKFVSLLNVINAAFAALSGQKSFTKAVRTGAKWGEDLDKSMGGAADSAKEFKRYLIGIDELNVIPEQSTPGGGGGGGNGLGKDYTSMFENLQIPDGILDFVEKIKDAIAKGDWYGVGSIVADKLNGVVSNLDTYGWGQKLGQKIGHGIDALYGFLQNFSFRDLGSKISELLNGALENINFKNLGGVFVRLKTSLIDSFIGFFENLDFGLVARSVTDFFAGAFQEVKLWYASYDWSSVGQTIYKKLKDAITNIDFSTLASTFFSALGSAYRSGAQLIGGFFGSIGKDIKKWFDEDIRGQNWVETAGNILKAIGSGFVDLNFWVFDNIVEPFVSSLLGEDTWVGVKEVGKNIVEGLFSGISNYFNSNYGWIVTYLIEPLINKVKSALGISSPSTVFEEIGNYITEGLLLGIQNTWESISSFFSDSLGSIKESITSAWESVKENTETAWQSISEKTQTVWTEIEEFSSTTWENIKTTAGEIWENIKSSISEKIENIRSSIKTAWEDIKKSVIGKIQDILGYSSSSFDEIESDVSRANSNMESSTSKSWNGMKNTVQNSFSGLPNSLQSTFSGLNSRATSWGGDIGISLANGIRNSVSHVISAASTLAGTIRGFLHFSEPDVGPLSDFHTYMPDMMKEIASGIQKNKSVAIRAVSGFASDMASNMGFITEPQAVEHDFSGELSYSVNRPRQGDYKASNNNGGASDNSDVINAVNAIGLRIIRAIESKDLDLYFDTQRVGRSTTDVQNRQNRMYGKSLSNA